MSGRSFQQKDSSIRVTAVSIKNVAICFNGDSARMRGKFPRRNKMATLKRIGPGSAFKVGLVTYAFLGLVVGACFAFFSMIAGSLGGLARSQAGASAKAFGFGMGLGAIIFMPILYGIIGGIGGALGAVIYSLAAGWVGGLE